MIHPEAVTPQLLEIAKQLTASSGLSDFRMVGGTAIALQLGHRKSVDIDFFANKTVNKNDVKKTLTGLFPNCEFVLTEHSISFEKHGVRVELYDGRQTPFLEGPVLEGGLRMASLHDLAAFKLDAIVGRREKKDYLDLYVLFEKLGASPVLDKFKSYNPNVSVKSILFALEEAHTSRDNKSVVPEMLIEVSWNEIEKAMVDAAREFLGTQNPERPKP